MNRPPSLPHCPFSSRPPLVPERSLLELQRSQMERLVADQVAEERRALLASQTAAMRADVERNVAEERAALVVSLNKTAAQVWGMEGN